ncbi:MAG: sensor histidine kinase [Verrucomicrobia bacterium]|nr:sensor histidine kinase [Verrucomicrobiota bacterium]
MSPAPASSASTARPGLLPWLVVLLTLAIFAATIYWVSQNLREKLRAQILGREGEILNAVTLMQELAADPGEAADEVSDTAADHLGVMLRTSKLKGVAHSLKGVQAARLFDAEGNLVTTEPAYVSNAQLSADELAKLRQFRPVTQYFANARLADLFWIVPDEDAGASRTVPLLVVAIPLHRQDRARLFGVAQFSLAGEGIAAEFAALDRNLLQHALLAFVGGGLIIVASLGWAFRRLQQTNRLLTERTTNLLRANHELTLAAKTSAVGAVASHLIHGLKNPLFGLHSFVASRTNGAAARAESDWQEAVASTRRMQAMITDVVRVLREETSATHYEISLDELRQILAAKIEPVARDARVQFTHESTATGALTNRNANLVLLILENLLQNAIQATPAGRSVRLALQADEKKVVCEVRDEGPGLPPLLRDSLFQPVQSSKADGAGIGLAISKQLANHLGAELELKSSTAQGCVFALSLPLALLSATGALAREAASA